MENRKPAWWQLFMLAPIMLVLVMLESFEPLPGMSVQFADAGIVVLFFVAVLGWVHVNGGILERYYMEQDGNYDFKITVYPPTARMPKHQDANHKFDWQDIELEGNEKWSHN